jgi:hypothetical protein
MDISTPPAAHLAAIRSAPVRLLSHALVALVAIAATGLPGDAAPDQGPAHGPHEPDLVAEHVGGIAARLHADGDAPIPGHVFLLLARAGSTARARLYDRTPYTHDGGDHDDTRDSNRIAARVVEAATGSDVEILDLTSAPGGGASAGLAYAIAYLDAVSGGAFTGELRVAATGRLDRNGHVGSIDHIDLKTAAAHLADADVLFTPVAPSGGTLDAYADRLVGEMVRPADGAVTLNDPRRVDAFRQWGAGRPDGMDVVDARHLIDVAAYLCGSGSSYACQVVGQLDEQARQRLGDRQDEALAESERLRAAAG